MSMATRRLGRTGFEVSEIGYGAWGIGKTQWVGADDDASLEALRRALDLGVTFIDTTVIVGARTAAQLADNVKAADWVVTPAERDEVTALAQGG